MWCCILNETIKYTDLKFQLAFQTGIISPNHKSGDKFDPNNYGVCVNGNLGKILCMIINSRLLNFLTDNNAIRKKQKKQTNYHTTDHIFTLSTLIDDQINQTNYSPAL